MAGFFLSFLCFFFFHELFHEKKKKCWHVQKVLLLAGLSSDLVVSPKAAIKNLLLSMHCMICLSAIGVRDPICVSNGCHFCHVILMSFMLTPMVKTG